MLFIRTFRLALSGVCAAVAIAACGSHSTTVPSGGVFATPTPAPTTVASGTVLQSQTVTISAVNGGIVQTLNGSASFPGGVFTTDTSVTLQLLSRSNVAIPNAALTAVGPALSIAIGNQSASSLSPRVYPRAAAASAVAMKLYLPVGYESIDLSRVIPEVALTARDGQVYYLAFDGTIDSDGSVTINVPTNLAQQATNIVLYLQSSTVIPPSGGQPVTLDPGTSPAHWSSGVNVQPNKKTLVLVHGVLSSIQNAFPCASTIVQQGGYDQAVGISYDWSYPPAMVAPYIANLLDALGQQQQIDIEAHSYGVVNTLAALPTTRAKIGNLILLGGPIDGTPLASASHIASIGNYIPSLPASPAQLKRVSDYNFASILQRGSPGLARIATAAYGSAAAPHRTIEVAGNNLFDFERRIPFKLYLTATMTAADRDDILNSSDGIVPIASALSSNVPGALTSMFALNHTQLECDPAVISYVATNLLFPSPAPTGRPEITDYPVISANAYPYGIAAGSDGALWFTEAGADRIGRITTGGTVTEFPVLTTSSTPGDIAAGPDGALWFTEDRGNKIGRITPAGTVTEYSTPSAGPAGIAAGPDGALWFTEDAANKIGRITTSGSINEYPIATANAGLFRIAAGPDGAMWFTENAANKVGRITTSGAVTEYAIATFNSNPFGIAAGSDGALWFTEYAGYKIGRITTQGAITEYAVPPDGSYPTGIAAGPDGALWFNEYGLNKVGRITTSGAISEYSLVTPNAQLLWGITAGPDGAMWFTETNANRIGRIK